MCIISYLFIFFFFFFFFSTEIAIFLKFTKYSKNLENARFGAVCVESTVVTLQMQL